MRGSQSVVSPPMPWQEEKRRFFHEVDLNALIRRLEVKLRCTLVEGVRLEFHLATELPPTCADPELLDQLLLILAARPPDPAARKGQITIRTALVMTDVKSSSWRGDQPARFYILLSITHAGCEVQTDAARPNLDGAREILARHSGWMEIEAYEGVGTNLMLFLPARPGVVEPPPLSRVKASFARAEVVFPAPIVRQPPLQECIPNGSAPPVSSASPVEFTFLPKTPCG